MFFLATADAEGRPQCSYKGGDPGFVRVLDERTIAFPVYDGNGMYLSAGNAAREPARRAPLHRLRARPADAAERRRVDRRATIRCSPTYPEAQLVVRVAATQVFPNCPRYIHEYRLVERSRFVPRAECRTPVPAWKRSEWAHDALPTTDPANDPGAEVTR